MLKLSAYVPSLENADGVPSPLVDVVPPEATNVVPVPFDVPTDGLPVEEAVVLPPTLDPTPLEPLEAEIIQPEVIAAAADQEASQLMGAQIALEGYGHLLRSANKNMTRQSAAFMAVGMRRAHRLLGDVTLGLEDETSGTQVMAMQKSSVNEKGLGSKLKDVAAKIWEWIKNKAKQFMEFLRKLRGGKEQQIKQLEYLAEVASAVESGNTKKVEALEAPQGIKVAQVLDAIHGEEVRNPPKTTGKSVKLPAKLVQFMTRDGKLDLSMAVVNEVRSKVMVEYIRGATGLLKEVTAFFKSIGADVSGEEVADRLSDMVKKNLGGKAGKWELNGLTITLSADGVLATTRNEASSEVEVEIPTPQQLRKYMQDVKLVLDSDLKDGEAAAEAYIAAQEEMMSVGDALDNKLSTEKAEEICSALGKVLKGNSFEDKLREIGAYLDQMSNVAIKGTDFFLSHLLGKGNTISQEDYLALPSPTGPGLGNRLVAGAKEVWRKIKEYFSRLWQQFSEWATNLWKKLFGTEKDTDILLLTNEAVPEDGQPPRGTPPQLPNGSRLKSVQATRLLSGPSAAPGEPPVVPDPEPEPVTPSSPSKPSVPKGMVDVFEATELTVDGVFQLDPVWEEQMTNWLVRHYVPTQEKIARDLISYAGSSEFKSGIASAVKVIERALPALFKGMPELPVPGERTIKPTGYSARLVVRREGMPTAAGPVKIAKKRQIDQALARQKKLLKALATLEKSRIVIEQQRNQLNMVLDRLVAAGVPESDVADFYKEMEITVLVSSATVVAGTITKMCDARVAVCDAMITARAKGNA